MVSYRVFSENYSPLKEIVVSSREMTSWRRSGWQFFRIFGKRTSSGEFLGYFWMRSCIDVVILTGFLCLEFGDL
ncbi:hypothetical protein Godav_021149 [Gossypium davidsonii]|uniref:Uncharacterized protein n=2 Tax=Gossypium TaxID=3633 RepID=A0A7J8R6Q9_GOSDV|nr:hypothetical protein [Gossypium davidsonii]MBA0644056.1 hypothetical protein [Gossypium klotzschianum]